MQLEDKQAGASSVGKQQRLSTFQPIMQCMRVGAHCNTLRSEAGGTCTCDTSCARTGGRIGEDLTPEFALNVAILWHG